MTFGRLIICACLCVAITSKVKSGNASYSEDLVDEYYTIIPDESDDYLPQDENDAQAIVDSDRSEKVIAGILPFRDKLRRFAINKRISAKIEPVQSYKDGKRWEYTRYWISESFDPQYGSNSTYRFWDLCFGLLIDESIVLAGYMDNYFRAQDETWIIIGMILAKDMQQLIASYNLYHADSFKDGRNSQRKPFKNMLRVWARHNREQIEKEELNHENVAKDANTLKTEHDSGDWHEKKRDQLELILMKKSIKYARAVITEFEKLMGGKAIEDIIKDSIQNCKLNPDLADAYGSLARYVKNKHKYIAEILAKYCDGNDYWGVWIVSIAVVHPQEWPKVDEAFRKDNKGQTLKDFILQKLTSDKIMAEIMAVMVDPKYKPISFSITPPTKPPS